MYKNESLWVWRSGSAGRERKQGTHTKKFQFLKPGEGEE